MSLHPAIPVVVTATALGGAVLLWWGRKGAVVERIAAAYPASADIAEQIAEVAAAVDADPFALANLINFESGFNPRAYNPSGASGLIQFMPASAAGLGTTTEAIRQMSAQAQMSLVQQYLEQQKAALKVGSLQAPHKLAMSVFYPRAMAWPSWAMFPWNVIKANGWKIFTPGDYVERMGNNAKLPSRVGLFVNF